MPATLMRAVTLARRSGGFLMAKLQSLNLMRVEVVGDSMEPTLLSGDRLIAFRRARPKVGDLVVISDPRRRERFLVKRVSSVGRSGVEVLGDNPESSTDSRVFGVVAHDLIYGVARYRYGPPGRAGRL